MAPSPSTAELPMVAAVPELSQLAADARERRSRHRRREARILALWRLAVLGAALLLWSLVSLTTSPLILPGPGAVLVHLVKHAPLILKNMWVTLAEILLGFLAGGVIGIVTGTAIAHSRRLEAIFRPYIATSQAVPKAALAPIFVLWLGFGIWPKVTIAALISFFPLLENTIIGLRRVDPDALRLFASLGASPRQVFTKLRLPNGLPYIMAGLRVGIVFATVGAIVGEFVTANQGLGALIVVAQGNFDTKLMFAVIAVLTAMGVVLYDLVRVLERLLLRRYNLGEGEIELHRTDP